MTSRRGGGFLQFVFQLSGRHGFGEEVSLEEGILVGGDEFQLAGGLDALRYDFQAEPAAEVDERLDG